MEVQSLEFGRLQIDGRVYTEDIVIDGQKIQPRRKDASRKYKHRYGHTPLSAEENIPWQCKRLVIGSGIYGSLPVMPEVEQRAEQLGVELLVIPTRDAIKYLNEPDTNFVLHLTC
ncbi:MAG TPA: hypothetical protein ENJ89_02200 [Caldithrix abyssi]|uniref:Uncharacterized protein n=1 Tax=Caldithrix abyssi TaxID=187145 RepID=A0A7V5PMU7_CALAY|nr:hypothetical protein [Caldithrix abyssi]